jgi:hypothetical protein
MIARRFEKTEPAGQPLHWSIRHSPDDASLDRLAHEHDLGTSSTEHGRRGAYSEGGRTALWLTISAARRSIGC